MPRSRRRDIATLIFAFLGLTFLPFIGSLVALALGGWRLRLPAAQRRADTDRERRIGVAVSYFTLGLACVALLAGVLVGALRGPAPKPILHRAARPEYIRCALERMDARRLVGMDLRRAQDYAHGPGCEVRVLIVDGKGLAQNAMGISNRVNVATEDGVVVRILTFG